MKKINFFLLIIALPFLFFLCKKPDITPAFLVLSEKDFEDCIENDRLNYNKIHGEDFDEKQFQTIRQQAFVDVLVSLNGQNLGYWTPPCRIPLLPTYSGNDIIRIIPCARTPHTSLTTTQYLFLKPLERSFEMAKEREYTFANPIYEYVESVKFPVLEIFESSTTFSPVDSTDKTKMELVTYEEKNVGKITLKEDPFFFNVITSDYYELYGSGIRCFWEMYYKSENGDMTTYLTFRKTSGVPHQDMIVLPASNSWKKVYIDLTDVLSWASESGDKVFVKLGIRGQRNSDSGVANFYFDHVKLITMDANY